MSFNQKKKMKLLTQKYYNLALFLLSITLIKQTRSICSNSIETKGSNEINNIDVDQVKEFSCC